MIAIEGIVITEAMTKAGEDMASDCYDASIRKSIGGLGGCKHFAQEDFPNNGDLIGKYLEEDLTSVQVIYLAMDRAKNDRK